jgi:DNA-binding transcriptional ArsR family regulator
VVRKSVTKVVPSRVNRKVVPKAAKEVVLRDVKSIRALAHPARILGVGALYEQNLELSATEAAKIAGVSPSAMSYHLRALERYGIVTRAEARGDGRERPWKRAGAGITIRPVAGQMRAAAAVTGSIVSMALDDDRNRLLAVLERKADRSRAQPLDKVATYSRTVLRITVEEAEHLAQEFRRLLEPYEADQPGPKRPDEGRISVIVSLIPESVE